jgi:hypothetical protein
MAYARGKRSKSISDRSGQAFPYQEMVREWTGALVHISEYEPKHPQIRRKRVVADAIALQNSRAQDFQQPETVAAGDITIADSGGDGQAVINLSLPGVFAFAATGMVPDDPSVQAQKRELSINLASVTVVVS